MPRRPQPAAPTPDRAAPAPPAPAPPSPPGSASQWSSALWALRRVLLASGEVQQAVATRLGIGSTDAAAIDHLLSAEDGLGPVELGHRLGIRSASATTLVDRLERAGHVYRAPHASDRRRQTIRPTAAAATAVAEALRPMLLEVERIAQALTPDEAELVTRFLGDVAGAMRRYARQR